MNVLHYLYFFFIRHLSSTDFKLKTRLEPIQIPPFNRERIVLFGLESKMYLVPNFTYTLLPFINLLIKKLEGVMESKRSETLVEEVPVFFH